MSPLHRYPSPTRRSAARRPWTTVLAVTMLTMPVGAQAQELRVESRERVVLEIDGVTLAQFQEVSGVKAVRTDKWANITLKRGTTSGRALREWYEAGRTRDAAHGRRSGSIIQYDREGNTVARYRFINAWPSKLEGAGAAVVSVTIVGETIRRVGP